VKGGLFILSRKNMGGFSGERECWCHNPVSDAPRLVAAMSLLECGTKMGSREEAASGLKEA
jgi:hypothetical protein